jgi:arsenate reductase
MKKKVLFVCIHNSARSQMAEAFLNKICGGKLEASSAGLEPGKLNPIVGTLFAWVITVCDEASAQRCPIFPGVTTRLHWSFPDPSGFQGTHEEKLARTREVRDAIEAKVKAWCAEVCPCEGVV